MVKNEIRVLGVDDGKFTPKTRGRVLVVGVVFRGGISIEAVMHTHIAIDGLNATEKLAENDFELAAPPSTAFGNA